jgi:hypothetical protein
MRPGVIRSSISARYRAQIYLVGFDSAELGTVDEFTAIEWLHRRVHVVVSFDGSCDILFLGRGILNRSGKGAHT